MDPAGADVIRPEGDHLPDEGEGLLLTGQQDLRGVLDLGIAIPAEHLGQMAQGLDARDELDPHQGRVVVDLPDLLARITAPEIAEERLVRQLIGLLGIEHQDVVTRQGHPTKPFFHIGDLRDGVARAIVHDPVGIERRLLPDDRPLETGQERADNPSRGRDVGASGDPAAVPSTLQREPPLPGPSENDSPLLERDRAMDGQFFEKRLEKAIGCREVAHNATHEVTPFQIAAALFAVHRTTISWKNETTAPSPWPMTPAVCR